MTELPTRTFEVFGFSSDRAEHWKKHHGPCREGRPSSERNIQWRFADCGAIGQVIHIACLCCGAQLDVSDYEGF